MGLKLRMGLALSGLALSSMFGVNMLSGIKVGEDFLCVKTLMKLLIPGLRRHHWKHYG